jgi:hypothetical protein
LFFLAYFKSQDESKFGFIAVQWRANVWLDQFQIFQKVKNAKKGKNFGNSIFWIREYRFLLKKKPKSGRRGGAEFGTHGFEIFQNLFLLRKLICH